jgi:hypothetical protein
MTTFDGDKVDTGEAQGPFCSAFDDELFIFLEKKNPPDSIKYKYMHLHDGTILYRTDLNKQSVYCM